MRDVAGWLETNGWDITSREPLSARQDRGEVVQTVHFAEGRLRYTLTRQTGEEQMKRGTAPGGGPLRAITSSYVETTVTAEYDDARILEALQAAIQLARGA